MSIFKDIFKAMRAGLLEMAREFKRRRWQRKFSGSSPF